MVYHIRIVEKIKEKKKEKQKRKKKKEEERNKKNGWTMNTRVQIMKQALSYLQREMQVVYYELP